MSKPFAEVIGDPIAQSKSPAIHNFWLAKLGLDAEYRAAHVKPPELADYITDRRKDPDWRGCNVTMPHKLAVREQLDHVEAPAKEIGAVNTVYPSASGLLGTNTDAAGFLEPLLPLLRQTHLFRMARIIGAGGAARAIVHALAAENFTLVLAARDPAKAQTLLAELVPESEHHTPPLEHFAEATDFAFDDREGCCDLIVNASPLGMRGHPALPFDLSHTPPGSIFYDIVTDPVDTEFLKTAREGGFRTIDGLSMLIGQAAAAFALFFGQPAPREHDGELRAMLTR